MAGGLRWTARTSDANERRWAGILARDASAVLDSLVLDLAELSYISSAGVRSVFKARKVLASRGGRVLVVNLQPQIRKVFDIVKAVPVADVFASQRELDDYLDTMQKKVLGQADED